MKIYSILLLLLYGLLAEMPKNFNCMKKIDKNGMTITWSIKKEKVHFEVFAPTAGWVAIGLNEKKALIGNNLIMGAIIGERTIVSDQYIAGFGDHKEVEQLGGQSHVSNVSGKEETKGTTIRFAISKKAKDTFHYNLSKGKEMTLLIAYANHDDFNHHSAMRTSIKIIL